MAAQLGIKSHDPIYDNNRNKTTADELKKLVKEQGPAPNGLTDPEKKHIFSQKK